MSALDERMREITTSLQEIHLHYKQKIQSLEDELASIKAGGAGSCLCVSMAPTLWSALPEELVQQIFACLPPRDIVRLQCLSKKWEWNVTSRDSEFNRTCAEAGSTMLAMVSAGEELGIVSVNLYDVKANRWHSYEHEYRRCGNASLFAGDGGLVMCVNVSRYDSRGTSFPWISVFNPLFPERDRELPHEALRDFELQRVQLVMDRDKRCYKVLVVGEKECGSVVAKIFSSETGAWDGEIVENLVFGHQFTREDAEDDCIGPCAYDSVGRQLLELDDGSHPCLKRSQVQFNSGEVSSACYALVKDHLFVLHEETIHCGSYDYQEYYISEYRARKCEPHWVKLRMFSCLEYFIVAESVLLTMSLYACKGFLLVKAETKESKVLGHWLTWIYDMPTEKWKRIRPFGANPLFEREYNPLWEAMFEVQWDAIPLV